MSAMYKNGLVAWRMAKVTMRDTVNVHGDLIFQENGRILVRRSRGGYRQWAIVPRDAMGSVADWLETKGWMLA